MTVSAPDTHSYPDLYVNLELYDASGRFIRDAKADELELYENGEFRLVEDLELIEPGVQILVALNPGPEMANRYAGQTRLEALRRVFTEWAAGQTSTSKHAYNFVTTSGVQAANLSDPAEWSQALQAYQPDILRMQPALTALTQAVDAAVSPPSRDMKRVIYYLTVLPLEPQLQAIQALTERAASLNIRVNVWLVATPGSLTTPAGKAMQTLASATGGEFFLFTGPETPPSIEAGLDPLRQIYRARYRSKITGGGLHTLEVKFKRGDFQLAAPPVEFELNILPPNPIFVQPPSSVELTWQEVDSEEEAVLQPAAIPLQLMLEFPDGRPRALKRLTLFLDGQAVVEFDTPPFDLLALPTRELNTSGQHLIRVEVEDIAGLSGSTLELPVAFNFPPKPRNLLRAILREITWQRVLVVLAVLAAGALLAGFLIRSGKRGVWTRPDSKARRAAQDPLTQPIAITREAPRAYIPAGQERPSWPLAAGQPAPARLVRISEPELQAIPGEAFAIIQKEVTIGSNPRQAQMVVDDSTVQGLHARIFQSADGAYVLADAGSTAGSWLNYAPVSSQGAALEHGDIIHFGRAAFRFELARPPLRQLIVKKVDEHETD